MAAGAEYLDGPALQRAVRRNTALLSFSMAVLSAAQQLVAAIASLTFVLVTGIEGLLGLGPAIFLVTAAFTAVPAGRAMDRFGRVPVLATGFGLGVVGGLSTALGARLEASIAVILGFVLIGAASGTVFLARAAAGDMYPAERRARGIAFVLFGAVFGAVLGPAVFSPLVAGSELDAAALAVPWLAGAGFMAVGLVLVLSVRPDPKAIAEQIQPRANAHGEVIAPAASLSTILARRGVIPALLAALASFGVMVSVMNLIGFAVVDEHGHHQSDVFPIIGAHVLGMFALVLVVGSVIDRLGTTRALVGGLALMGASCAGLVWGESVVATAVLLFALGLGWNVSFVAATAALIAATAPAERGKLLGFNDLLSSLLAASLALAGGYALQALGVIALAAGSAALVVLPAAYIAARGVRAPRPALSAPGERR
jgi:MFS family permease